MRKAGILFVLSAAIFVFAGLKAGCTTKVIDPQPVQLSKDDIYDLLVAEYGMSSQRMDVALGKYLKLALKHRDDPFLQRSAELAVQLGAYGALNDIVSRASNSQRFNEKSNLYSNIATKGLNGDQITSDDCKFVSCQHPLTDIYANSTITFNQADITSLRMFADILDRLQEASMVERSNGEHLQAFIDGLYASIHQKPPNISVIAGDEQYLYQAFYQALFGYMVVSKNHNLKDVLLRGTAMMVDSLGSDAKFLNPADYLKRANRTQNKEIANKPSFSVNYLNPNTLYIDIREFDRALELELLDKLRPLDNNQIHNVVVDLRGNPGGLLTGAIDLADIFLDEGIIVYTKGKLKDSNMVFRATQGTLFKGKKLVVMVDGGSAGSSEIFAGAVRDKRNAIIVGSKTAGMEFIGTVFPLHNNYVLKVPSARIYSSLGRSFTGGVLPTVCVNAEGGMVSVPNTQSDCGQQNLENIEAKRLLELVKNK